MKGVLTKRNVGIGGAAGLGLFLVSFVRQIDTPGEAIGVLLVVLGCGLVPFSAFMAGWWLRGRRFTQGQL